MLGVRATEIKTNFLCSRLTGNSLGVRGQDSVLSLPRARVQSLVRELRSQTSCGAAEKNPKDSDKPSEETDVRPQSSLVSTLTEAVLGPGLARGRMRGNFPGAG